MNLPKILDVKTISQSLWWGNKTRIFRSNCEVPRNFGWCLVRKAFGPGLDLLAAWQSPCWVALELCLGTVRTSSEPFGTLVKSRHISLESLSTIFFCRYSAAPFQLLAGRVTPASSSTLSAFSASPHHPEGLRKSYIPTRFVLRFCGENWHLKLVETEMEISMKRLWKTIYRCHVFEVLDLPTDWNTERHQSAQT